MLPLPGAPLTMACAAGRRGLKRSFAPDECPKSATLTRVRQHGQHHAGLGALIYTGASVPVQISQHSTDLADKLRMI